MKVWSVVPWLNNVQMTIQAVGDLAGQRVNGDVARVLVVGVGVNGDDRVEMEKFCQWNPAVLPWWHDPGLPSLSATWNRALRAVWEMGADRCLVANNDVRVTKDTWGTLSEILDEEKALLVTATGVEEEETLFEEAKSGGQRKLAYDGEKVRRGGPGFSLFMISRECNARFPFDENLIPAFCEDVDMHRRMILAGEGQRIFGTNVRYLHLGGQTLKAMPEKQRRHTEALISRGSRAWYAKKWGGGANEEDYVQPFQNACTDCVHPTGYVCSHSCHGDMPPSWVLERIDRGENVTTPALFEEIRKEW